tara:strand:+ start:643 stop:897 length:255 start_codon:yes stop_codon:yes gene_type:complete
MRKRDKSVYTLHSFPHNDETVARSGAEAKSATEARPITLRARRQIYPYSGSRRNSKNRANPWFTADSPSGLHCWHDFFHSDFVK